MKSRSKKGSKHRYITARDVLADIPSPPIARRLTVKPLSTEASERRAALGVFLDDWENDHGPITSVELDRAGKELRKKSQVLRETKTVKPKR